MTTPNPIHAPLFVTTFATSRVGAPCLADGSEDDEPP